MQSKVVRPSRAMRAFISATLYVLTSVGFIGELSVPNETQGQPPLAAPRSQGAELAASSA
jgi:hypothetical protein